MADTHRSIPENHKPVVSLSTLIRQCLCPHKHVVRRTSGARLFVQCLECDYESVGIETGGFTYNLTAVRNDRTWVYDEKPSGRAIFSLEIGQ